MTFTAALRIDGYGKTARRGQPVWKFGHGSSRLIQAGWKLVHRGSGYEYLAPPTGHEGTKRPVIEVQLPSPDEIEWFAAQLHQQRQAYDGTLCGWPVRYRPSRSGIRRPLCSDITGRQWIERQQFNDPATFSVGESCVWTVDFCWRAGDDAPPHCYWSDENIVAEVA